MADSASTRNRFRKQEVGAKTNAWGGDLNEDGGSDRLDEALDGYNAFTLSGSKTLTATNYETDEARMRTQHVTAGTGGTVTIPAVEHWNIWKNAGTGTVAVTNGSASVNLVSGETNIVATNGSSVIFKLNPKEAIDAAILTASLSAELPSQEGNAGKALTTDGSVASWGQASLTAGVTGVLPVVNGGTGISALGTGVTTALAVNVGSAGAFVVQNGALGTPSSGTLTSCTGLPVSTGISGLGTNVASALSIAVGLAGAPVVFNGALGTPSSGTLTSCTGLPVSTGVSGFGAGIAAFLATATHANFAAAGAATATQLGSTAASGTNVEFTGISQAYSLLVVVVKGLSHDNGATQNLTLEVGDGSTYSGTMVFSGSVANTVTWYGGVSIPNYTADAGTMTPYCSNLASSPSVSTASSNVFNWRVTSGIRKVRVAVTAGNFDAGTIELWGI